MNPHDFVAAVLVVLTAISLASILLLAGEWGDA